MRQTKKQRVIYKSDINEKSAELEKLLFGANDDPLVLFEREKEEGEDAVADLLKHVRKRGGLLHGADMFFEDTNGAAGTREDSSNDNSEDELGLAGVDSGDEDIAEGTASERRVKSHKTAVDDSEEEEMVHHSDDSDETQSSDLDHELPNAGASGGSAERPKQAARGGADGQQGCLRESEKQNAPKGAGRASVWSDPDDARLDVNLASHNRLRKLRANDKQKTLKGAAYEEALRKQHATLNPRASWANTQRMGKWQEGGLLGDDDDEGAGSLLARAGGLLETSMSARLPAGQIETTRLKDANRHQPSEAVVQAVRFHPNGQMLLTAGFDKKLRLFSVDGLRNPILQRLHLDDMPLHDAAFVSTEGGAGAAAAADRVVMTGRRSFFYVYDMGAASVERVMGPSAGGRQLKSLERFAVQPAGSPSPSSDPLLAFCGDCGTIPLVSMRSRQWVANLQMSGNVRAMAFSDNGQELLSTGDDAMVHVWDLRMRRCRLAFADSGNVAAASSLALSADGRYVATGSAAGVVNVYERASIEAAAAQASSSTSSGRVVVAPARELLNLTTNVDTLIFSPDSQMLGMASRMKRDSLRLVHLPSLTVFANWPTGRTPLHYVHSMDFSPHCGLLAIGNAKGRALLYRLHHYQRA